MSAESPSRRGFLGGVAGATVAVTAGGSPPARAAEPVKAMTDILGLDFTPPKAELAGGNELVGGLMQLLLDLRANVRDTAKTAAKDNPLKAAVFAQTDLIRTRLAALGVTLEDRPAGTSWRVG